MLIKKRNYTKYSLPIQLLLLVVQCYYYSVADDHLSSSSSNTTDQYSLLAFKKSIEVDPYNVLATNWTEKTNMCDWVGVICSHRHRQRVTALRLPSLGLVGTISPHLANLSFLMRLDLANNSFHGGLISADLGRLRRLNVLILQFNKLEGVIPKSLLLHCRKLRVISLAHNRLTGHLPEEMSTLPSLRVLFLGLNNFTGTIPPSFGNLSRLQAIGLEENKLHGSIPNEITCIPNLQVINFYENYLTGSLPPSLFNISSLLQIMLPFNGISGDLPVDTGLYLPNLIVLNLGKNQLSGNIPLHLSNATMLAYLYLAENQFTGTVPTSLGHLELLVHLTLEANHLKLEPNSEELSFISAFTRLRSLEVLVIDSNPFRGTLPDSVGNLSSSLQMFFAWSCQIKGRIPESISNLTNLNNLQWSDNDFSGTIPSKIRGMKRLQRLYLGGNQLEGPIPSEICHSSNLGEIDVQNNKLSGSIPGCIGNLSNLQRLFLDSNKLNSTIPYGLWSLGNLLFLNLSFNSLSGDLGLKIKALKSIESIDLSWNQMSGTIPSTWGAFQSLSSLNLSHNSFWGSIPESFGNLITMDSMDLSNNNLSGPIPKSLVALLHLSYLNLSYNKLSGEIPSGGPFANFTKQSFLGNGELCGLLVLQHCSAIHGTRKSRNRRRRFLFTCIPAAIAAVAVLGSLLFVLKKSRGSNVKRQNSGNLLHRLEQKMFSFQELLRATDNLCETNLLGVGSFGSVYKGTLFDGTIVAVKLLNLQHEGAIKSFDAECKVLRTVRHRNLVKVISACTNPELRALVLQYMSNGSLEKWLYSHNYCLNLIERISIMLDVALALEYLHHGQSEPVVHCDLKPSNVLLDDDMVAHVGDFGIAKILAANKTVTQTKTLGTFGYIAPEYGAEGRVSTKGDVYSYGLMLLETFTRKKPVDEMFAGELSLRQWVSASLLNNNMMEVVDIGGLFPTVEGKFATAMQHNILWTILDLGLDCSKDLPEERSNITNVVVKLNRIKSQILYDDGGA